MYGFRHQLLDGLAAWVAALAPGPTVAGFFAVIGRYLVEEDDEYLREQMVRRSLVATGFASSIAAIRGFLENVGLAPRVHAYYAAILWFAGLGLGALVDRLRTGDASC